MRRKIAAVKTIVGRGVPLKGNDIDTDRIIPARFLRCVTFEGLGEQLFYDERYNEQGEEKKHPLNDQKYKGGSILVVNNNFGCGSSREHAPQALMRFGIRAIVGESFAEIFAGNCTSLGMPVLTGSKNIIEQLQNKLQKEPELRLTVDVEEQSLSYDTEILSLQMNPSSRTALIEGNWNTLDVLLANEKEIEKVYERLPYT